MFWKKEKESASAKENNTSKEEKLVPPLPETGCELMGRKLKTLHARGIFGGKLYDTEKSEELLRTFDERSLFVTESGRYFSCKVSHSGHWEREGDIDYDVLETIYHDIRLETDNYVMDNLGKYDYEKYIELFGEVEEA